MLWLSLALQSRLGQTPWLRFRSAAGSDHSFPMSVASRSGIRASAAQQMVSGSWRLTRQLLMRLRVSPMSCRYTAAALYSGTADSSSSMKRWLDGSASAALSRSFAATTRLLLPHHVCDSASRRQVLRRT